jgi:prepilin-type N-terminal cleavage/methylation domain-containing protein
MGRTIGKQHGFSLIETIIVIAFACILMAMAIPIFKTAIDQSNADSAAQLIAQELNLARALAVSIHGSVLVQFNSNSVVVSPETGSIRGPFSLPGKAQILAVNPVTDTPDSLGSTILGAGSRTQIAFLDNGAAATDQTGTTLCSGTFFIRNSAGNSGTVRAVTLLGGTGRIRIWRYDMQTTSWKWGFQVNPKSQVKRSEEGFTLIETLIAVVIMAGTFIAIAGSIPLAAMIHRGALEREQALSLAQYQIEYFLTNPGPMPGDTGTKESFVNAGQFPPGFTGSYNAYSFAAGSGLTLIVVQVTPPHAPKVEFSAIDTTFSNIVP